MASYSGMSEYDIQLRENYKKQQAAAITASRDYKKNNYLSAMGQQTATQPAVTTTPKTNTNTQTLGGSFSTGGSSSSGGYTGGGYTGGGYIAGSGTTSRNARRNAHAADIRSGYKLRNQAYNETQNLSYYDKLSDYDRGVREQYFYDTAVQEAKTAREIQSLEDENTELFVQSVPIAQRASAGATGARHHNNFLQNQIADNNARIDQLKGIGPVIYPKDADALREKYASDIATSRAETDAVNSSITADDLDGMSREDYEAGSEKHLAEQKKRDAVSTAAVKGMEALDLMQKYQSKRYNDSFGGNFGANFSEGQLALKLDLAHNDYLDDPTEGNWEYIQSLEKLYTQFQKNNSQALDNDAPLAVISQDMANSLPTWLHEAKAATAGTAAGALASYATGGLIPSNLSSAVGGTLAGNASSRNVARGRTFKELLHKGVDKEIAAKAAKNEGIVAAWVDTFGVPASILNKNLATSGLMHDTLYKEVVDKATEHVSNIPIDSLKEALHATTVEQALSGNVDGKPQALLEEAIARYHFLQGFDTDY